MMKDASDNQIDAECTACDQPYDKKRRLVCLNAFFRRATQLFKWGTFSLFFFIMGLIGIDQGTSYWVKDQVYTDINQLPDYKTAVVLGTAKYYAKGEPNLYYKYRIDAATQLIKQEKVAQLLVSGDNQTPYYNEPKMMTNDLRRAGVQNRQIQQDFAGFHTLDSIIRADKVFQVQPFIIVSQQFHCERALFIAKTRHIQAVCFVAKYPDGHIKVRIREVFARVGMLWDYLSNKAPTTYEKVKAKVIPKQKTL